MERPRHDGRGFPGDGETRTRTGDTTMFSGPCGCRVTTCGAERRHRRFAQDGEIGAGFAR
jgi:hypothetical protein